MDYEFRAGSNPLSQNYFAVVLMESTADWSHEGPNGPVVSIVQLHDGSYGLLSGGLINLGTPALLPAHLPHASVITSDNVFADIGAAWIRAEIVVDTVNGMARASLFNVDTGEQIGDTAYVSSTMKSLRRALVIGRRISGDNTHIMDYDVNHMYFYTGSLSGTASIDDEPVDTPVYQGLITESLEVEASSSIGTPLIYRWYASTVPYTGGNMAEVWTNSTIALTSMGGSGAFPIPAGLTRAGSPDFDWYPGEYWYFVNVGAFGAASVTSEVVTVTVNIPVGPPPEIGFTTQPTPDDETYTEGDIPDATITSYATVTNVHLGAIPVPVTYRWYRTAATETDGDFTGVTTADMAVPKDLLEGVYYFYVVATGTGATGEISDFAKVTINPPVVVPVITFEQVATTTTPVVDVPGIATVTALATITNDELDLYYEWFMAEPGDATIGVSVASGTDTDEYVTDEITATGTYVFTVVVTAPEDDEVQSATSTVAVLFQTPVLPQDAPLASPTASETAVPTHNTITLAAPASATPTQFRVATDADDYGWQNSLVFTDLEPNTAYIFQMRYAAAYGLAASPAGPDSDEVWTTRATREVPAVPTMLGRYPTSITLTPQPGAVFQIATDGDEWGATQTDNIFTGLVPDSGYVFRAMFPETGIYYATDWSASSATITTTLPALTGTATVVPAAPTFGQVLSINYVNELAANPVLLDLGTISYQWTRDGEDIDGATAATYTTAALDVGRLIRVVISTAFTSGAVVSAPTPAIEKAATTATPTAVPTASVTTTNSITINAIPDAEFRIALASGTVWLDNWTTNLVFDGLTADTEYLVQARLASTTTHLAGPAVTSNAISTEAGSAKPPFARGNINRDKNIHGVDIVNTLDLSALRLQILGMGSTIADPDIRLPISGPTVAVSTIPCPINAYTYNINHDLVINTVDLSILRFHVLQMWDDIIPANKMVGDPSYVCPYTP
jgi:hypothetical protein